MFIESCRRRSFCLSPILLVLSAFLLLFAVACGDDTTDPQPVACTGRFEVLRDGACAQVAVTDIREEEVSFERDGYVLKGTLTLPVTADDYQPPSVLLLHGSGPNDRDVHLKASLGITYPEPFPMFRSLAHLLAAKGLAVMRYDKRTCFSENSTHCTNSIGDYPGSIDALVFDDFVDDARTAVAFLAARTDLRPNDVTLIGHSQGGRFMPALVHEQAAVSGGIGLGAAALPLIDGITGQLEALATHLEGVDPVVYQADIDSLRAQSAQYRVDLAQVLAGTWPNPSYLGASIAFWQSWDAWTKRHEDDFTKVTKPMLQLAGSFDFNVWPEGNLNAYQRWIDDNTMVNAETALLPNVTHAFATIDGVPPQDYIVDLEFSPMAIDRIWTWLQ